jgi:hypothetical protein
MRSVVMVRRSHPPPSSCRSLEDLIVDPLPQPGRGDWRSIDDGGSCRRGRRTVAACASVKFARRGALRPRSASPRWVGSHGEGSRLAGYSASFLGQRWSPLDLPAATQRPASARGATELGAPRLACGLVDEQGVRGPRRAAMSLLSREELVHPRHTSSRIRKICLFRRCSQLPIACSRQSWGIRSWLAICGAAIRSAARLVACGILQDRQQDARCSELRGGGSAGNTDGQRCLESRIWQSRLVSQADLYPGVPSRSLLRARCCSCRSCTPGSQSLPYVADGPIRGSPGTPASRRACTYARSWSSRACT